MFFEDDGVESRAENKKAALTAQLRTEREFRFLLLYLLDHKDQYQDLLDGLAPLYSSEMSRIKSANVGSQSTEFSQLLKVLTEGIQPSRTGEALDDAERRRVIIDLVPPAFPALKQEIERMSIPIELFRALSHTLSFYQNMENENAQLEERIEQMRSKLTTIVKPAAKQSGRSDPSAPRVRSSLEIDPETASIDQLKQEVTAREKSKLSAEQKEAFLRKTIEKRWVDVKHLQLEVERLKKQVEQMRSESPQGERIIHSDNIKTELEQKRKEANEVTMALKQAREENRRLKKLLGK